MRKLKLFLDAKAANTPPRGISKASRVIFSVLTLLLLSVGNVWAEVSTLTFTAKANGSGTADDGVEWTVTSDGSESNFDNTKGIHYGTSSASVQYIRLSTSGITETITKVEVNASTASGVTATVGVTVGTTDFKVENSDDITKSLTATATNYTFTGSASGEIVVTVTKPSSATKAIYCKSIAVTYSTGGNETAVETIELNKDKLTLTVDDEETLTATVSPDNASNKNVTWESDDTDVATVENGLVTAVGAGDATITCKSVADPTKYAECAVHVNPSPYTKSTLIFTAACGGSGTADDAAVWTVTSDGEESNYDGTSGIHYGTNNKNVTYLQLETSGIEGTVAKVVVNARDAQATATISVNVGEEAFSCANATATNTSSDYTFTGSGSGNIVVRVDRGSSMVKAIYVKSIVVYYIPAPQKTPAGLAYNDEDLSNLVKLGDAFTAPTLTNPHNLDVAYESSNTDVAEVAANGAVTIKAVGVAEITVSFAGDEDYKAGSAQYALYVVAHEGTEADPYTVADARVVIDKVGETGIADKYATGIVSKIVTAFNSDFGNITYDISSDGATESAQLRAYRGFDKDGAWFTSEDDVIVGDEVVVKGLLKKYNTTYEFDAGNQLVSLNRSKTAAGLAYAETAVEKNIGDAAFTNALTNPNNLEVSYSSSATGVATVDENGEVTIVGMGTTTIKATFAGNGSYLADEVSYTLTVNDPSLTKVTFDATVDIASDNAEGITKNGVNIKASHVDGVNGSNNAVTYYQCFKNATFTATCTSGNIKRIEFSCTSSNPASGFGESYADGVWTGDAAIVEITATVKQVQMNTVTVYYKVDARAEAGLAYAETAIEKHVGDEAFVNALTNPNNLTVAYESSNTDVAEVAANGTVTIKAEGATMITASFDGDADYKPASVSYELTVNEAGLDNVTFNSSIDLAASGETTISKDGFTLTFSAGSMDGTYSEYRLHKSQTMTLSSTDYKIKKIEFTCTAGNPIDGFEDATGLDKEHNQWTGDANKVELTASIAQVRITQMIVYYVEDTRAASGLAWSANEVEITLGDAFTPANLVNPNSIDASAITIESDNTDLAVVNDGVVSLVADATGTAHITATFAGNETYKPASISYTIIVNDPTPTIYVDKLNVNFGSVEVGDAVPAAKTITISLTNVAAVTATLGGTNPEAFSISKTEGIVSGDEITISVLANTDAKASYSATLTISDGAEGATDKTVNLSFEVTEPVTPEDPEVRKTWDLSIASYDANPTEEQVTWSATYVNMVADKANSTTAANNYLGGDANNRTSSRFYKNSTLTITPNAKEITSVVFTATSTGYANALQGSEWTNASASVDGTTVTVTPTDGKNAIIAVVGGTCGFTAVQVNYKNIAPEPPTPSTPDYTRGVTAGNYGTICLPKAGVIEGATLFEIAYKGGGLIYVDEILNGEMEAGVPYIFYATSDQLSVVYDDNTVAPVAATDANGLHGFYDLENENATLQLADDATLGNYILYQNAYWLVSGRAAYIVNYRAYIKLGEISTTAPTQDPGAAPRRRVAMTVNGEQTATGIGELNASETPVKMIIDGQLFIIRGEKMYNVNGQVVK